MILWISAQICNVLLNETAMALSFLWQDKIPFSSITNLNNTDKANYYPYPILFFFLFQIKTRISIEKEVKSRTG